MGFPLSLLQKKPTTQTDLWFSWWKYKVRKLVEDTTKWTLLNLLWSKMLSPSKWLLGPEKLLAVKKWQLLLNQIEFQTNCAGFWVRSSAEIRVCRSLCELINIFVRTHVRVRKNLCDVLTGMAENPRILQFFKALTCYWRSPFVCNPKTFYLH